MKIIKSDRLIEKYKDSISSYVDVEGIEFELLEFSKGELLIQPSFYCHSIYFLVKGRVNVYSITENGNQYVMDDNKKIPLLGDMEFMMNRSPMLFVEAMEDVFVLSINTKIYGERLHHDSLFLHSVIYSCMDIIESTNKHYLSLEERVLGYMKYQCEDHILKEIEKSANALHCSRRQLQRVLHKLVMEDKLIKLGKGRYGFGSVYNESSI